MKKRIIALSTTVALLSSFFATPASASTYIVKKGDTLAKIAKKYDLTVSALKKVNKLKSDKLLVNQKLVTTASSAKKAEKDTVTIDETKTKTYTIVAGDTLTKIANKHHLTLAELKELNPKLSSKIYVGKTVIISKTASKTVIDLPSTTKSKTTLSSYTYTVVTGDSLSKIAKKASTTVSALKAMNKLTSDTIKIGQKLKIGKDISGTITTTSAMVEPNNLNVVPEIDTVISEAKKLIGTPYLWAGATPAGFDCSGFVYYAFKQAGYDISRHSAASYYSLGKSISSPTKGDLVFFATGSNKSNINHMGIYLGNDEFIHSSSSKGVQISSVTSPYYQSKLVGFKRLAF